MVGIYAGRWYRKLGGKFLISSRKNFCENFALRSRKLNKNSRATIVPKQVIQKRCLNEVHRATCVFGMKKNILLSQYCKTDTKSESSNFEIHSIQTFISQRAKTSIFNLLCWNDTQLFLFASRIFCPN